MARKPELVSFDNIDYEDPIALRSAQESMLREQWIRSNALRVCRRALEKCYRHHGVNHYEECRDLAEKYMQMLPTHKVKGFYGYQRNDPSK
ncbi:unnamed protein product [Wickerhamomyces anomalus]